MEKPMKSLENDKRKGLGHRLAIVEGHLRKVRQMVDSGSHCVDIIHQSRAIQQALKKFDEQVMHQHLTICVARDIKQGSSEKVTKELMGVFTRT
jgi:DNA-binding FrmR family transcriptional regulator